MAGIPITVVCVFGMASGHLLKNSLEMALEGLDVSGVDISVSNMDTIEESPQIILCSETLRDAVIRRGKKDRVYGVSSILDVNEVRKRLIQAFEENGYKD